MLRLEPGQLLDGYIKAGAPSSIMQKQQSLQKLEILQNLMRLEKTSKKDTAREERNVSSKSLKASNRYKSIPLIHS